MPNMTLRVTSATLGRAMTMKNSAEVTVDTEVMTHEHDVLPPAHGFFLGYAVGVLTREDSALRFIDTDTLTMNENPVGPIQISTVVEASRVSEVINAAAANEIDEKILNDDQATTAAVYRMTLVAVRMDMRDVDSSVDYELAQEAEKKLNPDELKALLKRHGVKK